MADREVVIKFVVKDDGSTVVLNTIGQKLENVGAKTKEAASHLTAFGQSFKDAFLGGIVAGGTIGVVQEFGAALARIPIFLKSSIDAFAESERANALLQNSLRTTGQLSVGYVTALNNQAQAQARLTTFTDEQVAGIQRQLVLFGSSRAEVERLTPKVIDLAVATDRDLGSALLAITKYSQGNVDAFTRLGLRFDENATQAEKLAKTEEFLSRTQGAARIEAEQLGGSLKNLDKEWGELKETTGHWLSQLLDLPERINHVKEAIHNLAAEPSEFDAEVQRLIDKETAENYLGSKTLAGLALGPLAMRRIENQAANTISARRAAAADSGTAAEQASLIGRAQGGDPAALAEIDALLRNNPSIAQRPEFAGLPRQSMANRAEQEARAYDRDNEIAKRNAKEAEEAAKKRAEIEAKSAKAEREERERIREIQRSNEAGAEAEVVRGNTRVKQLQNQFGILKDQNASWDDQLAKAGELEDAERAVLDAEEDALRVKREAKNISDQEKDLIDARIDGIHKERDAVKEVGDVRRRQQEEQKRRDEEIIQRRGSQISNILGNLANTTSLQGIGNAIAGNSANEFLGRIGNDISGIISGQGAPIDPATGLSTGVAGGGVPWALIIAGAINGIVGGLTGARAEQRRFGATDQSTSTKAISGFAGGVIGTVIPSLGALISKNDNKGLGIALDIIFGGSVGQTLTALGAFNAPSRGTQVQESLDDILKINSPYFPLQRSLDAGGRTSTRTKYFSQPLTSAEAAQYVALGFGTEPQRSLEGFAQEVERARLATPGRDAHASTQDIRRGAAVYEGLIANAQPGVSEQRFTGGLAISQYLFGGKDSKPGDVQVASNALISNLVQLQLTSKEASAELKALAKDLGFTVPDAFLTFSKQAFEGTLTSMDQFQAILKGTATLLGDDLPRGIDIYAAAMAHAREVTITGIGGETTTQFLFDARAAIEDLNTQIAARTRQEQAMQRRRGFAGNLTGTDGISGALEQDIFGINISTLNTRGQRRALGADYRSRTQAGFNALNIIESNAAGGTLTSQDEALAVRAFDAARAGILGQVQLAADQYGVGTARYRRAVAPLISQLGELEKYATLIADDTKRVIDAYREQTDRIVNAINEQNAANGVTVNIDGGSYTVDGGGTGIKQSVLTLINSDPAVRTAIANAAQS